MIYATEQQVVVTAGIVMIVGLVAFTIGLWTGHGREREYVAELEEELKQRQTLDVMPQEIAHEPWPVHVDQALAVANEDGPVVLSRLGGYIRTPPEALEPTAVILPDQDASVTAWTAAMAADMDRFMTSLIGETDKQLKEITR